MAQTMYAHVNKRIKNIRICQAKLSNDLVVLSGLALIPKRGNLLTEWVECQSIMTQVREMHRS
jgi:hypothetical protein